MLVGLLAIAGSFETSLPSCRCYLRGRSNEEMNVQNKKSTARRLDTDAGAAFGLIIGIIIGSALLNVAGPVSRQTALGKLSAIAQPTVAELCQAKPEPAHDDRLGDHVVQARTGADATVADAGCMSTR
jgi:hypothetical protein